MVGRSNIFPFERPRTRERFQVENNSRRPLPSRQLDRLDQHRVHVRTLQDLAIALVHTAYQIIHPLLGIERVEQSIDRVSQKWFRRPTNKLETTALKVEERVFQLRKRCHSADTPDRQHAIAEESGATKSGGISTRHPEQEKSLDSALIELACERT